MSTELPRRRAEIDWEGEAREYLRLLPPEHFMEPTPQAAQREITLESLALVRARRPDVHVFNELLVQYQRPRRKKVEKVVPDNMVVLHAGPIEAVGSFDVPRQPAGPFWVLEYVCKSSERKDYVDNLRRYERHLRVPYYLTFYPENQELALYRHAGSRYSSVHPNAAGRLAIAELELEVALAGEWARFWYRGELLPLPDELLRQAQQAERLRRASERQRRLAVRQRDEEREARLAAEAEVGRLRAELERLRQAEGNP